jgi:hypothetical protein
MKAPLTVTENTAAGTAPVDTPESPTPPRIRRFLAGIAVAAYYLFWAVTHQGLADDFGPVFALMADIAFVLPMAGVVRSFGPSIGYRRNAWLLFLLPVFGLLILAGAIYRLALLPFKPWTGTLVPYDWTRGFKAAVALGTCFWVALLAFSVPRQQWPLERTLDDAVARKLTAANREALGPHSRLLAIFDRGEEALALVEVTTEGQDPIFRAWWFEPHRSWWRTGWRLDTDSIAGTTTVLGDPKCSDDFHDWCRVGLPESASGFTMEFENGRTATGSASDGLGVAFVRPSAPPVRVIAYNSLGQVVADYPVGNS